MPTSAEASSEIRAPIDEVWRHITDLPRYGAWNPFVVRVDGPGLTPGSELSLQVRWEGGGGNGATVVVTRCEGPAADASGTKRALLEYRLTGPLSRLGLLRSVRTQALTQGPDGATRYETREVFEGALNAFVPRAKVQRGFEIHAAALKARAEGGG